MPAWLLPSPAELRDLVLRQLGSTSVFAAKFREAASRALLLPRRRPGMRAPLWQQRKRAADLLGVASRYESFPILLETYREVMRDVFDIPATVALLRKVASGKVRVTTVDSTKPSPFASALLFSYIANYIYEGDAPLAERRAQALAIDQAQLQELLGESDLRELLDAAALDEVESQLQALDPEYQARHADGVHDLLLRLGDLSERELALRCTTPEVAASVEDLARVRRVLRVRLAGETGLLPSKMPRVIAMPSVCRCPPACRRCGWSKPPILCCRSSAATPAPMGRSPRRRSRRVTASTRRGLNPCCAHCMATASCSKASFVPPARTWSGAIRRCCALCGGRRWRAFAGRSSPSKSECWDACSRAGKESLSHAVGWRRCSTPSASCKASRCPRRSWSVRSCLPASSTTRRAISTLLMAAGEVVWVGVERIGERDGRVALYLTENLPHLLPPRMADSTALSDRAKSILAALERSGASFFADLHDAAGGGFAGDTLDALWELVWAGLVTNDTAHPLRSFLRPAEDRRSRAASSDGPPGSPDFLRRFRARTGAGSSGQGRWSLVSSRAVVTSPTEWVASMAQQLLVRYGVISREAAAAENIAGGYSAVYPALRTMEESGWIRRGMFVAGMGAAQFAMNSAVEMLRSLRNDPEMAEAVHVAATDPANPYGGLLPWPRLETETPDTPHGMARISGASVVMVNGTLAAFFRRRNPALRAFLPADEPDRSRYARALANKLAAVALKRQSGRSGLLIGEINGSEAREHFLARYLLDAGFVETALGFQMRRASATAMPAPVEPDEGEGGAEDSATETA